MAAPFYDVCMQEHTYAWNTELKVPGTMKQKMSVKEVKCCARTAAYAYQIGPAAWGSQGPSHHTQAALWTPTPHHTMRSSAHRSISSAGCI